MEKLLPRSIAILNLTEALAPELSEYFANKSIPLIDPSSENLNYNWTHILTRDVQDFSNLRDEYKTLEKDIRILSLSNVEDLQNFALNNGKLILDEIWLKNKMGEFILDKFFQGYGGIALGDSYPTFKEKGSFNIINPFNTGEYLDRLVQSAYLDGMSGLSIKTYFDHLVMYLAGLKSLGKLGMPIEVSYGSFEEIFAVQIHFYTKNLILEDVMASLSGNISKRAEEYLLNVTVKSCDFFDFTLLKEVNKTVVTGLWTKDSRIQVANRGLLLSELTSSAVINNYPIEGITSFQMNDSAIEDFSDKIVLSSVAKDSEQVNIVKDSNFSSESSKTQLIHASKIEEEFIRIVKGKIEEEERNLKIKGSKNFDLDQFIMRVSAGVDQKIKAGDNLKIKSLKNDLPLAIKSSFNDFTASLNKSANELTELDLKLFNDIEVTKIIKKSTAKVDNLVMDESDELFKEQVVQKMHKQKDVRDDELVKLATLIDKETMLLKEVKASELELKKLQIESSRKETVYKQEIEKLNRMLKGKDIILSKTKEGLTNLVERRDAEIISLNEKIDQTSALVSNHQSPNQSILIRELERRAQNAEKMSEIYKAQITQRPIVKSEDGAAKEEIRKLNMSINQLKNQSDATSRELTKLQEKNSQDQLIIVELRAEKTKLDHLLKKTVLGMKKEESAETSFIEKEYIKLHGQFELLDKQLKESQNVQKELERKLQDALKLQKKELQPDDSAATRVKTAHLEGSVKKLTADLIESKNQLAEMKKETNKLRQEKTALQNQIDRMKKDADRAKAAAPKKPGAGGKAA